MTGLCECRLFGVRNELNVQEEAARRKPVQGWLLGAACCWICALDPDVSCLTDLGPKFSTAPRGSNQYSLWTSVLSQSAALQK